jgi:hypothetical protein
MKDIPIITPITYRTQIAGFYNLVENTFQREKMLCEAIPNNLQMFQGDIDKYVAALWSQVQQLELKINPLVVKHFTLVQQIDFIERFKRGEIKDEITQICKDQPQTEIPTSSETTNPSPGPAETIGNPDA